MNYSFTGPHLNYPQEKNVPLHACMRMHDRDVRTALSLQLQAELSSLCTSMIRNYGMTFLPLLQGQMEDRTEDGVRLFFRSQL